MLAKENFKEIFDRIKAGEGTLVDIREEEELRQEGIAEGAIWVPTSQMEDREAWNAFTNRLIKGKDVYLYCRSGTRAGRIAAILNAEGFHTVNLGGLKDWIAAQLPIKKFP